MPISGIVIACVPEKKQQALNGIEEIPEIEVYGDDEKGHIVAVIDTTSSEFMEKIIDRLNKDENILNVGLTYLNTEDEAGMMDKGEKIAKPFGFRKPLQ